MFAVSKATLTKEKSLYISSPVKAIIDLNTSTAAPMLQSSAFAGLWPSPPETLATVLEAANNQRLDVIALVARPGDARSHVTSVGRRLIVDVTIRDDSGPENGACDSELALFFPDNAGGREELALSARPKRMPLQWPSST